MQEALLGGDTTIEETLSEVAKLHAEAGPPVSAASLEQHLAGGTECGSVVQW
jgi:hypothetical protein